MSGQPEPFVVWLSARLSRMMLCCYPLRFQQTHGRELWLLVRDICRAAYGRGGSSAVFRLWPALFADVVTSAAAEWLTVLKGAIMLKRLLDLGLVSVLLVLTAPLLLLVALLIRLDSDGPVLFRQTRLSRNGRPFTLLKFRTMTVTTPQRVTRIGRWLRAHALDELPQLLNVLRGEMSLVGPRPPLPTDADLGSEVWQRLLAVTPGMAGPGQLLRQRGQSLEVEQAQNLAYIAQCSVVSDLRILGRTVFHLLGRP